VRIVRLRLKFTRAGESLVRDKNLSNRVRKHFYHLVINLSLIYLFRKGKDKRRNKEKERERGKERCTGNTMTFRSSTDNGAPEEVIRRRT